MTSSPRYLFICGSFAFILIGVLQAMYGPAFPTFRQHFGVTASQVGLIVSLHFLGSVTTILVMGSLLGRVGYRRLLTSAALLLGLGSLGIAFSPSWPLVLMSAFFCGLGFGGMDIGVNMLFGSSFGSKGAAALNLVNAMFGLGAILGPIIVAIFLPSVVWPFVLTAAAGLLLAFLMMRLTPPASSPPVSQVARSSGMWSLSGFILFYFLYVGSELGTGSWEPTHLAPAYGEARAAFFTSLFWAAFTVGRFIAAPLTFIVKPPQMVLGGCLLACAALAASHVMSLAPYAYALVGLALAPVFPTGLAWLQSAFPNRAARATSLVIASANLGGVVFPPLIGVVVEWTSSAAIPTTLTAVTLLCVLTAGVLLYSTRHRVGAPLPGD